MTKKETIINNVAWGVLVCVLVGVGVFFYTDKNAELTASENRVEYLEDNKITLTQRMRTLETKYNLVEDEKIEALNEADNANSLAEKSEQDKVEALARANKESARANANKAYSEFIYEQTLILEDVLFGVDDAYTEYIDYLESKYTFDVYDKAKWIQTSNKFDVLANRYSRIVDEINNY